MFLEFTVATGADPDITVCILKGRFPSFQRTFRAYINSRYVALGYCNPMCSNVYELSLVTVLHIVCYTYQPAMSVTCPLSDL